MKSALAFTATAAAAGLIAFDAPADRIEFSPGAGSSLTKTFTTEVEFGLEDFVMTMNGEEIDPAMMGGDFDMSEAQGNAAITLVVTDEYAGVRDGRPTSLLRTYDSMSAEYEMGTGESGDESMDEIEGQAVTFTWNADDEAYDREAADDGDIDDEVLASLAEDLDMRAMLPSGAVSEGDSWSLGWDEMSTIVFPGIDVAAAMESGGDWLDEAPPGFADEIEKILGDGEMSLLDCTYAGTRTVEGSEVAVIELSSEMDESYDLSDFVMDLAEAEGGDMGGDMVLEVGVSLQLEGEMLWNTSAGHVHSMDWDAEIALELFGEMVVEDFGMDMGVEAELSARISRSVTVE